MYPDVEQLNQLHIYEDDSSFAGYLTVRYRQYSSSEEKSEIGALYVHSCVSWVPELRLLIHTSIVQWTGSIPNSIAFEDIIKEVNLVTNQRTFIEHEGDYNSVVSKAVSLVHDKKLDVVAKLKSSHCWSPKNDRSPRSVVFEV